MQINLQKIIKSTNKITDFEPWQNSHVYDDGQHQE